MFASLFAFAFACGKFLIIDGAAADSASDSQLMMRSTLLPVRLNFDAATRRLFQLFHSIVSGAVGVKPKTDADINTMSRLNRAIMTALGCCFLCGFVLCYFLRKRTEF